MRIRAKEIRRARKREEEQLHARIKALKTAKAATRPPVRPGSRPASGGSRPASGGSRPASGGTRPPRPPRPAPPADAPVASE